MVDWLTRVCCIKRKGKEGTDAEFQTSHLAATSIPKWTTPFSCRGGPLVCQLLREL
jgi:hypothetical protein